MASLSIRSDLNEKSTQSSAFLLQNHAATLLPLLAPHPVALERRQRCHNAASDPRQETPLRRRAHWNSLHLYIGRRTLPNFGQHIFSVWPIKNVSSCEQDVWIQLFLDIYIAHVDCLSHHQGCALEVVFLVAIDKSFSDFFPVNSDSLAIRKLVFNEGLQGISSAFFMFSYWKGLLHVFE